MKGTNYLSATMRDEWSSGDDVDANGDKSPMEQQPIGAAPVNRCSSGKEGLKRYCFGGDGWLSQWTPIST